MLHRGGPVLAQHLEHQAHTEQRPCGARGITGLPPERQCTAHQLFFLVHLAKLISGLAPDGGEVDEEEELMRRALALWRQTGDAAGTARALFDVGLVLQVLRQDWTAAMEYFWPAFGLAEAVEESGDLYGRSEIHRHLGFYYLVVDVRPHEAVRQLAHSLALRERLGDPRRMPSALTALGEAEIAARNPRRAVQLLGRAVTLAREAGLLPWRVEAAEEALGTARAALSAAGGMP